MVNLVWRETNFCIDRFKPHENRFKGSRDIEESLWGVFLPPKATIKLAKPSATMRVNRRYQHFERHTATKQSLYELLDVTRSLSSPCAG